MVMDGHSWPDDALQRSLVLCRRYLAENYNEGVNFIDVGAHYGETFLSLQSALPNDVINYIGLEPDPRNFLEASKHILQSTSSFRSVQLLSQCAGSESTIVQFHLCKSDVVSGVLKSDSCLKDRVPDGDHDSVQTIDIVQTTIDNILEDSMISPTTLNILKVDTEGYDLQVLLGAKKALEDQLFDIVIAEFFCVRYRESQDYLWNIMEYLHANYYLFDNFYDTRDTTQGRLYTGNILFVSPRIARLHGFA